MPVSFCVATQCSSPFYNRNIYIYRWVLIPHYSLQGLDEQLPLPFLALLVQRPEFQMHSKNISPPSAFNQCSIVASRLINHVTNTKLRGASLSFPLGPPRLHILRTRCFTTMSYYFTILSPTDTPIFNIAFGTSKGGGDGIARFRFPDTAQYMNQFIIHSSLDIVEEAQWTNGGMSVLPFP